MVIFKPLDKENLLKVITLEVEKVQDRLKEREIFITLDEKAKKFLMEKGFQPEMGARPIRRTIERYLEDPLAEQLLLNPQEGRKTRITVEKDALKFIDDEVYVTEKEKRKVAKQEEKREKVAAKEEKKK